MFYSQDYFNKSLFFICFGGFTGVRFIYLSLYIYIFIPIFCATDCLYLTFFGVKWQSYFLDMIFLGYKYAYFKTPYILLYEQIRKTETIDKASKTLQSNYTSLFSYLKTGRYFLFLYSRTTNLFLFIIWFQHKSFWR